MDDSVHSSVREVSPPHCELQHVYMAKSKVSKPRTKFTVAPTLRNLEVCQVEKSASSSDKAIKRKLYAFDFDSLQCPICTEPFSPPVYQCQNGHTLCTPCCNALQPKKCPSCSLPIGIRNISVEKILESVQVHCKHSDLGCNEILKYTKQQLEHEERVCEYRPYQCPARNCKHSGPKRNLSQHFKEHHAVMTVSSVKFKESVQVSFTMFLDTSYAMLQSDGDCKLLFLVHHEYESSLGHIFFCTSFEDRHSDLIFYCKLEVEIGKPPGSGPHFMPRKRYRMSLETVVYSNQREEGSGAQVKEREETVIVPFHGNGMSNPVRPFKVSVIINRDGIF